MRFLAYLTLTFFLAGCHKDESVSLSEAKIYTGQAITSDTLTGTVKGTLGSGKTYYFRTDITVNQGDTLFMQEGSKLVAIGDGKTTASSPQITCNGTFISLGSAEHQNYITVTEASRTASSIGKGLWGGVQCGANSGDVIIKWTHLEFAGGPAGPSADPAVFASGDPRNSLSYTNVNGNFIFEDSWVFGTTDDGIRILHGKVSVMRNTFEACGKAGGEALNLKNGTLGDVGYNLVIGAATNGFKVSNSGAGPVQTNVQVYNNTILNCGYRQVKSGRGGSINYEKGAHGLIYNNMVINSRFGLRITPDADTAHTLYDNQFYYSNDQRAINQFNVSDGIAKTKPGDLRSSKPKQNNPLFGLYDVDQFDYAAATVPMDISAMPPGIIMISNYDFSLLPGSGALKKANADIFHAMKKVPQGGLYGATTQEPGVDMGAYQSDGTGNQHKFSSLSNQ